MKYLWQAILHRWYMGYWPTPRQEISLSNGCLVFTNEMNLSDWQMDQYIDPVIHKEINRFLEDVLEE